LYLATASSNWDILALDTYVIFEYPTELRKTIDSEGIRPA
jgi:hypothetical protein